MSEESGQDKTEEPTAQRLKKAREDGQIARSQELAPAAMMVVATLFFTMMGQYLFSGMGNLFKHQLQFDRRIMDKPELLPAIFGSSIVDGLLIVLPLVCVLYVIAILSTTLAGGFIFSPQMILPKFSKLNPMTGLARMFGGHAVVELLKSILKFTLIAVVPEVFCQREATAVGASAVPAMCDGVTQGQDSMELSLFSRDVIALSAAVAMSHAMFDGMALLGICDKIVPGLVIGALRFGYLPAIFVPGGPMPDRKSVV